MLGRKKSRKRHTLSFSLKELFLLFSYLYGEWSVHMSVSTYRGRRLSDPSELGLQQFKAPDGPNSGPQEEHYVLLTTEPSL